MPEKGTYLFLLLVEVVNDHTDEEVEGEEGTEDDEDNKVDVHVDVVFINRLVFHLNRDEKLNMLIRQDCIWY